MWEEAPVSKYRSVFCGWFNVMVLNEEVRDCGSHPASGL